MSRRHFAALMLATVLIAAGPSAQAASPPATWDGLVQTKSKRLSLVYLAPGADFRAYNKVMLDPVEIAFKKNWRRDFNRTTRSPQARVSERDEQKAVTEGVKAAGDLFTRGFVDGGYPVVTTAGPDVLRLKIAVINVSVSAPDRMVAGRTRTYANEAGEATLVVEAVDSTTGAILGRAVDRRWAGDTITGNRSGVTNRSDFRQLANTWSKKSVAGLNELKSLSPVLVAGGR